MSEQLKGKKIAILATNGVEESELVEPMKAIREAGGEPELVSLEAGKIKAWDTDHWADEFNVDRTVKDVSPDDYDALLLPGGVINPDQLRKSTEAVDFVKGFFAEGRQKPVGAICHGPWMLVNADVLKGRKVTSYASLKVDLTNAGAEWVDQEVVVDQGLVTSRNPGDLPAFNAKIVEEFCEGRHQAG